MPLLTDDRTPLRDFRLPVRTNWLRDDVERLRITIGMLDDFIDLLLQVVACDDIHLADLQHIANKLNEHSFKIQTLITAGIEAHCRFGESLGTTYSYNLDGTIATYVEVLSATPDDQRTVSHYYNVDGTVHSVVTVMPSWISAVMTRTETFTYGANGVSSIAVTEVHT